MVSKTKPGYLKKIQVRMTWLRKALKRCSYEYYVKHQPKVSDAKFDAMMAELRLLEETHKDQIPIPADTITRQVGMTPEGEKYKHQIPMLSLQKCTTREEVEDFLISIADGIHHSDFSTRSPWIVEPKLDGISLTLIFEYGHFVMAATRGDGEVGENVFENAKHFVPAFLPQYKSSERLEIRGEVLVSALQFSMLRRYQEKNNLKVYKNPRNAASGIMSQHNAPEKLLSYLEFVAYQMFVNGTSPRYHQYSLMYLRKLGLTVNDSFICEDSNEVMMAIAKIEARRKTYRYAVDGAVIKVNSTNAQEELGNKTTAPAWAIAFKYSGDQGITELLNVEWQTGRTGQVTPVAILAPVDVCGVTVSRCTLHNADEIKRLGLRLGDTVAILRAGDVIPKLVRVVAHHGGEEVKVPKRCPSCSERLYKPTKESVAWYCPDSDSCPAQITGAIEHFCSRQAMNIKGLGSELCKQLVEEGVLENVSDLYRVSRRLKRFISIVGQGNSGKLLKQIEASKKNPLHKLILGLGIDTIGATKAKLLASRYESLQALRGGVETYDPGTDEADDRERELKELLGDVSGTEVVHYFMGIRNSDIVDDLIHFKVCCSGDEQPKHQGEFSGQHFVITGTLKTFTREILTQQLEDEGAIVSNSVTKNTTALIVGDNPGSKLDKATKLGVPVLNEKAILAKLK